jgi:hypothetical protein
MDDAFDFTSDNGGYLDVPAPGVLGNDSYADQVELVPDSGPNSGSLTLGSNGSLLYTPTPGSSYVDSFQYIAIDSYTGIESQPATVTITVTCMYCSPLMLDQPAIAPGARALEMSQLSPLSRAAVERWRSAGVDDATIEARLAGLSFVILDLPGSQLGSVTAGGTIVIDSDAAGYGWFVDATPSDDREFQRIVSSSQKEANGGAAARAADLLTVLVHEIGHVLGLDHGQGDETNVMTDTLGLGMRRNPTVWDAAIVDYLYWQSQRRR